MAPFSLSGRTRSNGSNGSSGPELKEYFKQYLDEPKKTLVIGTCSCPTSPKLPNFTAYADLTGLPEKIKVGCNNTGHRWGDIRLNPPLRFLDPNNPKKKTTMTMLKNELLGWEVNRELAEDDVGGKELVLYNADMQARAPSDDDDVEEVVRTNTSSAMGVFSRWPFGSRSNTQSEVGTVIHRPATRNQTKREKVKTLALLNMARDVCLRYGEYVLKDAPYLLVAFNYRDGAYFHMALISALPKYFINLPPWLELGSASPTLHELLSQGLHHAMVTGPIKFVIDRLGIPSHDPGLGLGLLKPATQQIAGVAREALEEVLNRRANYKC